MSECRVGIEEKKEERMSECRVGIEEKEEERMSECRVGIEEKEEERMSECGVGIEEKEEERMSECGVGMEEKEEERMSECRVGIEEKEEERMSATRADVNWQKSGTVWRKWFSHPPLGMLKRLCSFSNVLKPSTITWDIFCVVPGVKGGTPALDGSSGDTEGGREGEGEEGNGTSHRRTPLGHNRTSPGPEPLHTHGTKTPSRARLRNRWHRWTNYCPRTLVTLERLLSSLDVISLGDGKLVRGRSRLCVCRNHLMRTTSQWGDRQGFMGATVPTSVKSCIPQVFAAGVIGSRAVGANEGWDLRRFSNYAALYSLGDQHAMGAIRETFHTACAAVWCNAQLLTPLANQPACPLAAGCCLPDGSPPSFSQSLPTSPRPLIGQQERENPSITRAAAGDIRDSDSFSKLRRR
ncbi:hypothetical protein RRG08_011806 [Elysia crispata]|uniref:Uncharacterized protein n=1 Tax=Elysia crispata TaxID=231223 RepID=A0AAE1AGI9_9GAST|nr:hypothetical protein RRG08_011806 [Elysia crispata]